MPRTPYARPKLLWSFLLLLLAWLPAGSSNAQDWDASNGGASSASAPQAAVDTWSFRTGMGFTVDPDDFLLNFELPYRFDRFVSAGPMMQVGLEDNRYIVAPTVNVGLRLPDMPGERFDRFHPNVFAGMGFAVISNDDRRGSHRQTGFLVNAGFGVDYQLSDRMSLGSRMILNFLPGGTLGEDFFFSWEVAGLQVSF